jgi:hypothetical protein
MPNQRAVSMAEALAEEAARLPPEPAAPVAFPRREPAPAAAAPAVATAPAPAKSRPPARPARKPVTAEVTESQAPLWQRLERKELRLRADQLDELARLRRALNRQRGGAGERITENTLIRVAVDMLLGHADRLRGTTEGELRKSVSP